MIYVFDLDGTLCETEGRDYTKARPIPERIATVNRLYREGHFIVIDSARGTVTKEDWQQRTKDQLDTWGVLYHEARTGVKFYGDVYIDDRAVVISEFFDA